MSSGLGFLLQSKKGWIQQPVKMFSSQTTGITAMLSLASLLGHCAFLHRGIPENRHNGLKTKVKHFNALQSSTCLMESASLPNCIIDRSYFLKRTATENVRMDFNQYCPKWGVHTLFSTSSWLLSMVLISWRLESFREFCHGHTAPELFLSHQFICVVLYKGVTLWHTEEETGPLVINWEAVV